jgi:hypothetical protein
MPDKPPPQPLKAFAITTSRDLHAKLQRDASSLHDEVSSDRLFNFFVTAWSLVDWIKSDDSVPADAKAARDSIRSDPLLQVCRDLANGCKHHTITHYNAPTERTVSTSGYGLGRYGKGAYGVGEESVEVVMKDGSRYPVLQLVDDVMGRWRLFFDRYGI